MMIVEDDILVEISNDNLPKLASIYQRHTHWAPHVSRLVRMGIRWKNSSKYHSSINFFSPNNAWERDGTIVTLLQIKSCGYHIFVFTLEESCNNLYEGLMKTFRIDYTAKNGVFFCVHNKHISVVMRVCHEKKISTNQSKIPYLMFTLSSEEACKFTLETSQDVYLKKLEPCLASQINSVWPAKFPDSEEYISFIIEVNGGYGLFLKDSGRLVAWVIKHCVANIGMLQTDEQHKRMGYGGLVTKALCKEIGNEGQWPFATVLADNVASIKMFERLGFRNIGICAFINIEN